MKADEWEPAYSLEVLVPAYRLPYMPEEIVVQRWEVNGIGERRLAEQWRYAKSRPEPRA